MSTHKELISSGKFGEKFKRTLLDYYIYGFKNLGSFDGKNSQTLSEDWLRLNRILSDYLQWSEDRHSVMFASVDSQSMEENPFHRIYRFCKYKQLTHPATFLHTMAALSEKIHLRGGLDALELTENQRDHLNRTLRNGSGLKTSDLLLFFTDKIAIMEGNDKNKTPNNRLNDLRSLGFLTCEQNEGKKGGKGDYHWNMSKLTMKMLLEAGREAHKDFILHFRAALDFFSKYYLFGEIGTFLLDRFSEGESSPFRFQHEYYMQALNDFNVADLLYAIENGKWCKIKYSHGTSGFTTIILCFPLEIRIGNRQGREYLMYYEPFLRSYSALRIEFIDSIEYFEDNFIKDAVTRTGYHASPETIEADIANVRNSLQYTWGISTTKRTKGNAARPVTCQKVSLQIAYQPNKENYIKNRLIQERRGGTVSVMKDNPQNLQFTVDISDEREMRPWVRSFYSRIVSCEGLNTEGFSIEEDVKKMYNYLLPEEITPPLTEIISSQTEITPSQTEKTPSQTEKTPSQTEKTPSQTENRENNSGKWRIPEQVEKLLGNGEKAREHDLLFNEIFGIYYYISN